MSEFSYKGKSCLAIRAEQLTHSPGEGLETTLRQPLCSLEGQGDLACVLELELGLVGPTLLLYPEEKFLIKNLIQVKL